MSKLFTNSYYIATISLVEGSGSSHPKCIKYITVKDYAPKAIELSQLRKEKFLRLPYMFTTTT